MFEKVIFCYLGKFLENLLILVEKSLLEFIQTEQNIKTFQNKKK